jgi:hypothetical protein
MNAAVKTRGLDIVPVDLDIDMRKWIIAHEVLDIDIRITMSTEEARTTITNDTKITIDATINEGESFDRAIARLLVGPPVMQSRCECQAHVNIVLALKEE